MKQSKLDLVWQWMPYVVEIFTYHPQRSWALHHLPKITKKGQKRVKNSMKMNISKSGCKGEIKYGSVTNLDGKYKSYVIN
jgi:hypothetical protein